MDRLIKLNLLLFKAFKRMLNKVILFSKNLFCKSFRSVFIATLILHILSTSCNSQSKDMKSKSKQQSGSEDRYPAVAGQFYPNSKDELEESLNDLFNKAKPGINEGNVLAIISPHAGYVFSGEIAATSFNQIDKTKEYENIFVIGSSHRVYFDGASIYNKGNYQMPMGPVKVNIELANKLINENRCFTYRADAHQTEHSLEVQLPFLQYILQPGFQIVPIVIASQSQHRIKEIAKILKPYFNAKNLFIISTDLSHFPDYENANIVDQLTAEAVSTNNPELFLKVLQDNEKKNIPNLSTSMCGWSSVLALMYMTEGNQDIQYHLIDYNNSGDSQYGDHYRVVGYYSISITEKKNNISEIKFELSDSDKSDLIQIARKTVNEYVTKKNIPKLKDSKYSENLKLQAGAFVTLRKEGKLRGCIGRFSPSDPLYKVVQDMAISSSTRDHRFNPVEPAELDKILIEISVLSPMKKIESIDQIVLGKHGIYIKKDGRSGTFLPHVATETGWTLEEFLGHCAKDKAGIGWNGWKDAEIFIYEAIVFKEEDFME